MNDIARSDGDAFDVLREIEQRTLSALRGDDAVAGQAEWVGIGIRIGAEQFIVARDEVREVLMMPESLTRVPGARSWIRGLSNVRGELLPLVDLRDFLGSGSTPVSRTVRVLVIRGSEYPAGIVVDEVFGFRRFVDAEYSAETPAVELRCETYLAGAFTRGDERWPVFGMSRLLESPEFGRPAA